MERLLPRGERSIVASESQQLMLESSPLKFTANWKSTE